jgi:hypothetical protein
MTRSEMVAGLDEEIRRLETVRSLLEQSQRRTAGLIPEGAAAAQLRKRRRMTPEGRQRIIEAQRRRWAKQKGQEDAKSSKAA